MGLSKDVGWASTTRHTEGQTDRKKERETFPGVFNFVLAAFVSFFLRFCFMAAPREAGGFFRPFGSHLNQTEGLTFGVSFPPEQQRSQFSLKTPCAVMLE